MPWIPGSNEPYHSPPPVSEEEQRAVEAPASVAKWVLRATLFLLIALALLCAIGPHIPAGG